MTSNRFDLLRLLFAFWVAVYHTITLSAVNVDGPWEQWVGYGIDPSIQGFFVISGALVYGSYVRSKSIKDYADKRIRRLYPAYAVIILIPAVLALVLTRDFGGTIRYLVPNLGFLNFLEPELPGLFVENRFTIVNGSLWTLKIEVMFYATLPILVWALRRAHAYQWVLLVAMLIFGEAWRYYFSHVGIDSGRVTTFDLQIARQLPGQIGYFACGIALWTLRDHAKRAHVSYLIGGLILFALSFTLPFESLFRAPGLALLIAWAAYVPGPALDAGRYGDMSYGVYIAHFPIVQALVAAGVFAVSPVVGFLGALVLTFAASFILWHGVEKRFLRANSLYHRDTHAGKHT